MQLWAHAWTFALLLDLSHLSLFSLSLGAHLLVLWGSHLMVIKAAKYHHNLINSHGIHSSGRSLKGASLAVLTPL